MYYQIETSGLDFNAMGTATKRVTLKGFREFTFGQPLEICSKTRRIKTNMFTGKVISDETYRDQVLLLEADEIIDFERVWDTVKKEVE